jgi:2-hydroxychromene-2-carboxylate isomerase
VSSSDAFIEFWFDFSSPYAYFAAFEIGAVAERHGRDVLWRPFLLGPALKATGMQPLTWTPLRGSYAQHDWRRLSRRTGLPFQIPSRHPIITSKAARLVMWSEVSGEIAPAKLSQRFFTSYFGEGTDISDIDEIKRILKDVGLSPSLVETVGAGEKYVIALKERTQEALARGIFGSPFFIVDGEPFWGTDRLPMIDSWLSIGGW